MNLVLVGLGAVTCRFIQLLETQRESLAAQHGLGWRVVGIGTGRHGYAVAGAGLDVGAAADAVEGARRIDHLHAIPGDPPPASTPELVTRVTTMLDDVVVVENTPLGLNAGQPGVDHIRIALTQSADVITANKGPAAFAFHELQELAERMGRVFLFEGSVLDGLPVFSLVRHCLPALRVEGFRGIVNTTTNHVLTAMESGLTIDEAVREMQAAGITEADPTRDIDGWDAAAKTAVLANVLLDARTTPTAVPRTSLRSVSVDDVVSARRAGRAVKFVASGHRSHGTVVTQARPTTLPLDDPLAGLRGTAKGLELHTDRLGTIQIRKSTSGVDHTAYALLADLVEVHRQQQTRAVTRQETGDKRE